MLSKLIGSFSGPQIKFISVSAVFLAMMAMVVTGAVTLKRWNENTYSSGLKAGRDEVKKLWDEANTKAAIEQRNQVVADAVNSNKSVREYLEDIMSRKPGVIEVERKTIVYAKSPDADRTCLDADAVSLLQENRSASGFTSGPPPPNTGAVQGTMSVSRAVESKP